MENMNSFNMLNYSRILIGSYYDLLEHSRIDDFINNFICFFII